MSGAVLLAAAAAAFAGGAALASLAAAAVFHSRLAVPNEIPAQRPTLILPATGSLPDLEALFKALRSQTLRPARLIVAVESRDDPAYGRVAALANHYGELAIELAVAGLSNERAQKCTNLLAAVAGLRAGDDYIVMFDADIRPQPWWLAALVAPLAAERADIVNGYRWPVPETRSCAATIVTGLDRTVAVLPRLESARTLWGGSIALTGPALAAIDMPRTLARALTEDLVIADRAAELGLRVLTRRALRVATPLRGGGGALWRFARRQMQLIHAYRPGLWRVALTVHTAELAARLTLIAVLILAGSTPRLIAGAALVAIGAAGSAAIEVRRRIGIRLDISDPPGLGAALHLLGWTFLPAPAFYVSAIWGSFGFARVTWGHVRYSVDRSGRVTGALRRPHQQS